MKAETEHSKKKKRVDELIAKIDAQLKVEDSYLRALDKLHLATQTEIDSLEEYLKDQSLSE